MAKKEKTEVLKLQPEATAMNPMALLQMAVDKNLDIDKLERLMTMQKDWQAQKAKESFLEAISCFQADCPEIKRIRKVDYAPKNGGRNVKYNFASLGDVEKQIKIPMLKWGLSKRWEIKEENSELIVTCLVSHRDGHTEMTAMRGKLDDSGSKNSIQQSGSTITYLKRYSMLAALGISTADTDDDGQGSSDGVDLPKVKEDDFPKVMKAVLAGEFTVEQIVSKRTLSPEQLKSLETAEKSRKEKP